MNPEVVGTLKLQSGDDVRLLRLNLPSSESVDDRYKRYIAASLGYDTYRSAVTDINYWRMYFRMVMDNGGSEDRLYLAEVNGQLAARVWFSWSKRSGYGNFGNVFTEPEFRRKGLIKALMKPLIRDFELSNAKLLLCSANKKASPIYGENGFEMIYGGESGPMCLLKKQYGSNFLDVQKKAFDKSPIRAIRAGTIDDQHDCDKFLAFNPEIRANRYQNYGPSSQILDFRCAYQESLNGNGCTAVAENRQGTIVAWGFALRLTWQNCFGLMIHPDNEDEAAAVLHFLSSEFHKQFPGETLRIWLAGIQTRLAGVVQKAGCTLVGNVPEILPGNSLQAYQIND